MRVMDDQAQPAMPCTSQRLVVLRPLRALLSCGCLLLALAACAPQANLPPVEEGQVDAEAKIQRELALRGTVAWLDQLQRVGWNIRAKNVELCAERTVYASGVNFLELDDYTKEKRDLVKEVLGISWRPTVFEVAPGSPAAVAGLRRGDIVVGIGGEKVENKKQAAERLGKGITAGKPVSIDVERAGELLELTLTPVKICAYPVRLKFDAVVNAFADGDNITVHLGLMKALKSDDELAAIVGHEMAHNTQLHIRDKSMNAMLGHMLIDLPTVLLTGVNPNVGNRLGYNMFSQEYEFEADYVGLYYTARAGYDVHHVGDLWRRMAMEYPEGISKGTTHPCTSQRYVALTSGAAEIDRKRAQGLELRPEMKAAQKAAAKAKEEPKKAAEAKDAPEELPGADSLPQ